MNRREFAESLLRCGCGCLLSGGLVQAVSAQNKKKSSSTSKPSAAAAHPDDGWTLYTHNAFGFQVRLPAEPREQITGASFVYSVTIGSMSLSVSVGDATYKSAVWQPSTIQSFATRIKDDGVTSDYIRKVALNVVEYKGSLLREKVPNRLIGRAYLTREIEYFVVARTIDRSELDAAVAQRLFRGFKLIPRVQQQNAQQQQGNRYEYVSNCPNCNGLGMIRTKCYRCRGFGENDPSEWKTEGRMCRWCYGKGYSSEYQCSRCRGTGKVKS